MTDQQVSSSLLHSFAAHVSDLVYVRREREKKKKNQPEGVVVSRRKGEVHLARRKLLIFAGLPSCGSWTELKENHLLTVQCVCVCVLDATKSSFVRLNSYVRSSVLKGQIN